MSLHRILALLPALALIHTAPGAIVEVVYSITGHTPGAPQTNVPGSSLHFTNFNNRMFRSPSSNLWLVVPTTDGTPATSDQVLVIGSGASGELIAREGITEFTSGEFIDFSNGIPVPRLSDSGSWVHAFTPQGVGLVGQRVVVASPGPGGDFTVVAESGAMCPAIDGANWGTAFHSPNVTASGVASFVASVEGASTLEAAFGEDGVSQIFGTFVSTPGNQPDNAAWTDIDTNLFYQDASGQHYIARGKLESPPTRDQVAVVDGTVAAQEGVTNIGALGVVSTITDVWMESDATWYIRGTAGGLSFISRNGVVIAAEGQPILPGSSEMWTSFQEVRGNNAGQTVIVGSTNTNALTNNIAVLLDSHVLARESDPIDLDRDGTPESNLFIHSFRDRCFLQNDGYFYFTIRMKSSADTTSSLNANASFVRVATSDAAPCPQDFNMDGSVDPDDLGDFINCYFSIPPCNRADFNADGSIDPDDLGDFINTYFGSPCS